MQLLKTLSLILFSVFVFISSICQAQNESFIMSRIGTNNLLDTPWSLVYGPDGYLWITERNKGIVLRVDPNTAKRDELIKIPDAATIGGQDGLLGMAIHKGILTGNPYVYLSYTYIVQGERKQKLVRYTYAINGDDGSLSLPITLIDNLPASNDHNSGRLIFGPDDKLYYTIGDQGNNQNSNYCKTILAQILPTQAEVDQKDWTNYPGKILRLNIDGSIPEDNPIFEGVRSHIYTYGHRNPQGLVFGNSGLLYSDEHGPNTDDEVNIIYGGKNYGWPFIAGYRDDQAYDYCNWSSATNCQNENYSYGTCPTSATFIEESSFTNSDYQEPLLSMFAVDDDYNFNDPNCSDSWICRPNVAPSSLGYYNGENIPSWKNSLMVVSLKRGCIFRLKLNDNGSTIVGDTSKHFYTPNRYRDLAIHPDGKTFYIITDQSGKTSDASGLNVVTNLQNPGSILKFTLDESVSTLKQTIVPFGKVWPNPVSEKLFFELNQVAGIDLKAELINRNGQVVKKNDHLKVGINEIEVDEILEGLYILKLSQGNQIWYKKLIIYK